MNTEHGNCPDLSVLTRYSHGELDEFVNPQIALHIERCDRCLRALDGIAPSVLEEELIGSKSSSFSNNLSGPNPVFVSRTIRLLKQHRLLTQQPAGQGMFELTSPLAETPILRRYKAVRNETGESCAISIAADELISSLEHRKQFLLDVQQAMELAHPNCDAIADFGVWDGDRPYFRSIWFEGKSLADVLTNQIVGGTQAIELLDQVCKALLAAHELGIVHRHLGIHSIFVTDRQFPIIVNFGLLYDVRYQADLLLREFSENTDLAPEVRNGKEELVDQRTDVYGLARAAAALFRTGGGLSNSALSRLKLLIADSLETSRRKRPSTVNEFWERLKKAVT